jgi:ribosomal-protein-alanine N-acetyltransferase
MQGLLNRIRLSADEIDVRPALDSDRSILNQLTERSRRVHFNLEWWTFDRWLYPDRASDAIWLAHHHAQPIGLLLAPTDQSPVAWLRASAIADEYQAGPIFAALLERAITQLHSLAVEKIVSLAYPDWLAQLLPDADFKPLTEVITFRKNDRTLPRLADRPAPAASIRRAAWPDVEAITANDRAAFDPVWWHSAQAIAHILKMVPHFIVAEVAGRVVGHAFSDLYGGQGHLIRLAVHPDYQRQGIGQQLLIETLQFLIASGAYPLTVNTQIDNLPSQALYRRHGYRAANQPVRVLQRSLNAR